MCDRCLCAGLNKVTYQERLLLYAEDELNAYALQPERWEHWVVFFVSMRPISCMSLRPMETGSFSSLYTDMPCGEALSLTGAPRHGGDLQHHPMCISEVPIF